MDDALNHSAARPTAAEVIEEVAVNPAPGFGSMGMPGKWAWIGQATGMMLVAVVMFIFLHRNEQMHIESVGILKGAIQDQREQQRDTIGEMRSHQADERTRFAMERAALVEVIGKNSQAVEKVANSNDRLAEEVRLLRIERAKGN